MNNRTIRQALRDLINNPSGATLTTSTRGTAYNIRVGRDRFTVASRSSAQGVRRG